MRGEQAIFNLEIKKKSGLSINPNIHHSKIFSSGYIMELKNIYQVILWNFKTFIRLYNGTSKHLLGLIMEFQNIYQVI